MKTFRSQPIRPKNPPDHRFDSVVLLRAPDRRDHRDEVDGLPTCDGRESMGRKREAIKF